VHGEGSYVPAPGATIGGEPHEPIGDAEGKLGTPERIPDWLFEPIDEPSAPAKGTGPLWDSGGSVDGEADQSSRAENDGSPPTMRDESVATAEAGDAARGRIDQALRLVAMGLSLFPLADNSRNPAKGVSWLTLRTQNLERIRAQLKSSSSYGVATGSGLVVIDVDHKDGAKNGRETFERLNMTEGFPPTFTVRTCTGGLHLYYRVPADLRIKNDNRGRCFGSGVDVKAENAYVVGPGSVVDGRPYVVESDVPISDLPQWALDRCKVEVERAPGAAEPCHATWKTAPLATRGIAPSSVSRGEQE
jgi:hypothetical protein